MIKNSDIKNIISRLDISDKERNYYLNFFRKYPKIKEKIISFWNKKQEFFFKKNLSEWNKIFLEEYKFLEEIQKEEEKNKIRRKLN